MRPVTAAPSSAPRPAYPPQPRDLRVLQDDWDREGLHLHMKLLRREAFLRRHAAWLDRLSLRFAQTVIALTALAFLYHAVRFAARMVLA